MKLFPPGSTTQGILATTLQRNLMMKLRIKEDLIGLSSLSVLNNLTRRPWYILEAYDERLAIWSYISASTSLKEVELTAQKLLSDGNGERFRVLKEFDSNDQNLIDPSAAVG